MLGPRAYKNHITSSVLNQVGNTPFVAIDMDGLKNIRLTVKLEYQNPTSSVKDRAVAYLLKKCLDEKIINHATTIIESSSGNMGVSLAAYCQEHGLKFICVVDPNILPINEMLIRSFGAQVIKVHQAGEGGFLLSRIQKVKELAAEIENSYWVNQYANPIIVEGYYRSLGEEICREISQLDYIFIGVGSGGTITGVSTKVREKFPDSKVIAVDIIGSVIFGGAPQKRYIPGIGSSMVPRNLQHAKINEVVMIDEVTTIDMCHELLRNYNIFAGGSSGSVYGAIKKYFQGKRIGEKVTIVTLFPDRGERYATTVYNEDWVQNFKKNHSS